MADAKITQLTNEPSPALDDLVAIVDDVAGTPTTKKATLANVLALASGGGLLSGSGHPQGAVTGALGELYRDTATGRVYRKVVGSGNTGWYPEPMFGSSGFAAVAQQIMLLQAGLGSSVAVLMHWGFGGQNSGPIINGAATSDWGIDSVGRWFSLEKNGNNGGLAGPSAANTSSLPWNRDFDMVWHLRTGADITDIKYWVGFSTADPSTDTISGRCIVFRYSTNAGDGGWVGVTNDNTGQSVTGTVAAIAADTEYKLRIRRVSNTVFFSVNDGAETSTTTKVPTDSTLTTMGYWIFYVTGTSAARKIFIYNFGGVIG